MKELTQEANKYLKLDKPSFGTPEWENLEKEIHDRRRLYEVYGIGTSIMTIDGEGTILQMHGRAVGVSLKIIKSTQVLHGFKEGNGGLHRTYLFKDYYCPLLLKPLSSITDEDAIEVAKIVHQRPFASFKVVKRYFTPFSVHVEYNDNINCTHHVSINNHGNINANKHFMEYMGDGAKSYKHNIGENDLNGSLPVPYIAVVDYLRSRSYALPWMGLSVEEMVQAGWIKLSVKGDSNV